MQQPQTSRVSHPESSNRRRSRRNVCYSCPAAMPQHSCRSCAAAMKPPTRQQAGFPAMSRWLHAAALLLALVLAQPGHSAAAASDGVARGGLLVVGSVNMDVTMAVARLPLKGETTFAASPSVSFAVGGKGANQAVAAARLSPPGSPRVRFVGRFGNDSHAATLQAALADAGVDISGCVQDAALGSGLGVVMLEPDGAASSVVMGGANSAWPQGEPLAHLVRGAGAVLLQREVPEHVNMAVATAAAAAGVPVLLDVGGEARPLPGALLPLLTYVAPNELELQAITGGLPTDTEGQVVAAANNLLRRGAANVLVTLAERGALLLSHDGSVLRQPALPVPEGAVVDGTAAGDAFRAAFAVGLLHGWQLQHTLQLAAAAGALAVSKQGALPSLPSLAEVHQHLLAHAGLVGGALPALLGGAASCDAAAAAAAHSASTGSTTAAAAAPAPAPPCPRGFASRLNSMKARQDLVQDRAARSSRGVLGLIRRQGQVRGLSSVHMNFPEHFEGLSDAQVLQAVKAAGLRLEALNLRFPPTFAAGAFANADAALRAAAVQLAVDGCRKAAALGADQLVVWPQYDGYDLHFQVDYAAAWQHSVEAFGAVAAACPPGVRVALEFKPTDAQARFGLVASTAAALLLVQEVGAPNLGLALDLGHLLMAGENPAQSVAMAARAGRLFGVHLNDAHARLGAEDGLPFASVNPRAALEVVLQLQAAQYNASVYFDTFPGTLDPVAEAALNIRTFKQLWCRAAVLRARMQQRQRQQDALGALQLLLDEQASVPGCADWADEAAWRAFERRERERKVWWWRWSEHD